ncbi:MAG: prolipoprotein diacylglyceryl transferase [Clostridia bacterium]|nr:prolipoprotein diacylglyceryl transferase [Clostridia bacterium]
MFEDVLRRIFFYYATYAVGFALMLALTLIRCRVYGSSRVRAAVYSFITFLSGFAGAALIGFVYNLLFSLKGVKTDIYVDMLGAVIFTSLFILAAVSVEKRYLRSKKEKTGKSKNAPQARSVSFRDTLDMMIPGSFLMVACIKIGCHVRGCCYGVEWPWGIHYENRGITVFPVQMFEFATICAILITCFFIKQTRFYRRGMAGPLTAGIYGAARFFWEFFRGYTPEMRDFLFGLTLWQLFSLLVIAVTSVWLAVLYKTRPSEPLPKSAVQIKVEEKLGIGKKKKAAKNKNATAGSRKKKSPAAKRGGRKR